ncbi:Oxo-4-hydroxy-4-carboxy-5-ureidoimidazoline decarboxylase, partial [Zopfochytrium polystomum]
LDLLFEAAPPLSAALARASPFASWAAVIDAAELAIANMPLADRLVVINAHPAIGAPKQTLSALSYMEQGHHYVRPADQRGATTTPTTTTTATNGPSEDISARLASLNARYKDLYGFTFVIFVNGRTRQEIADVLEASLEAASAELDRGLADMMAIARDRLKKLSVV